ncbi:Histone H1-delta [Fasciolopsis buskii]|uniref:Histone H1-delta n=1 Tax=Fasciolopsis buskii TaxID=27845 RepID=A0A8E0VH29_9TREM|nr:Histone H1-delta [Fasciolopsis buski]
MSAAQAVTKKSTKTKVPANHPPYGDMIKHAVKDLKERHGSSRQAITKYIKAHYKVDEKAENHIRRALVAAVKSGRLVHTKGIGASGSFKLAEKVVKPKVVRPKSEKKLKTPKKVSAVKKAKTTTPKKSAASKKPKTVKAMKPKSAKPKKATTPKKTKTLKPKKPIAKKTPKKAVVKK